MLTLGHPDGVTTEEHYIGRVDQYWNDEIGAVEGVFSFYDEYWDRIPEDIRNRIANGEPYPISAGYSVVDVDEEGRQRGILYDHIAVLRDGEDPNCPLGQCGINVRPEAEERVPLTRLEKRTEGREEVAEQDRPAEGQESPVTVTSEQLDYIVDRLFERLAPREQEQESEQPPQEAKEEVSEEESPVSRTVEPEPEPAIPADTAGAMVLQRDADGWYRLTQPREEK